MISQSAEARTCAAAALAILCSGCASGAPEGGAEAGRPASTTTLVGGCGPAPGLETLYVLPFGIGQAFELTQGNCAGTSHSGRFQYSFDFRLPMGTPVLAARAGRVVTVRSNRPDGTNRTGDENFVIVRHEDGLFSRYIHLRQGSARVAEGDRVSVRDTLALSGNSGRSRFPHLHFDVARGCTTGRCVTVPSAFSNAVPPIPRERTPVVALE
ncbi:MAG: M23 family metallopeptidase [Gemmatimonadota bacterium]